MQRRTVVAIAATVTAAGAAVATTLPSVAATFTSRDRTAAQTTETVAPVLLAAMKRDLGLSAAQATAEVKRAKWATGVASGLRSAAADSYAGSWLTDKGMTLNIGITDASLADEVRAAGAVPKLVTHSVAQLDGAKRAIDATGVKARGVTGWYVDVAANKVAVKALPGQAATAQRLARAAGIPSDAVKVVTVKSAPRPLVDVVGGQAYFIQEGVQTFRCSIGFSADQKAAKPGGATVPGFVTAGHCGQVGNQTLSIDNQPQGKVTASVFPGNADMGFVATNENFTPQPVAEFDDQLVPVAGSTEAPIGAAICRSGSTTGTQCGRITSKNQTVDYGQDGTVTGLTGTDACAEGGDSGGSWMVGDQAQGVTSGGSGDCQGGPAETFFQPINEILTVNKLTLLTQVGGGDPSAPPSDDPSAPPSDDPSAPPSDDPSAPPSDDPSAPPSEEPTAPPSDEPSATPPPADNGGGGQGHGGQGHGNRGGTNRH
jgi:streptogrisin C